MHDGGAFEIVREPVGERPGRRKPKLDAELKTYLEGMEERLG
jgi:hypothetical protein